MTEASLSTQLDLCSGVSAEKLYIWGFPRNWVTITNTFAGYWDVSAYTLVQDLSQLCLPCHFHWLSIVRSTHALLLSTWFICWHLQGGLTCQFWSLLYRHALRLFHPPRLAFAPVGYVSIHPLWCANCTPNPLADLFFYRVSARSVSRDVAPQNLLGRMQTNELIDRIVF